MEQCRVHEGEGKHDALVSGVPHPWWHVWFVGIGGGVRFMGAGALSGGGACVGMTPCVCSGGAVFKVMAALKSRG